VDIHPSPGRAREVATDVLAVLFLREAMAWDGGYGLLAFGAAVALVIATLTFFLVKKDKRDD
jgi:hypothetical protein